MRILKFVLKVLFDLLKIIAYQWIGAAIDIVRRFCSIIWGLLRRSKLQHGERHPQADCLKVSHPSFHRPDPCIYSQVYLMKLGLPVTWDNPDIILFRNGAQVPEGEPILPATVYEIEASLWNNSYDAPVVGMAVDFSFLAFGIATTSTPIGTTLADVGVKGSPSHPARTKIAWTTPATPGHYCLQVKLNWIDDANPENNLGQNNLNVATAQSPASFSFAVRNPFPTERSFRFTVDTYQLPDLPECKGSSGAEVARSTRIDRVVAEHRARNFGIPVGWSVQINPVSILLLPNAEATITAEFTPPATFAGRQAFNVNAIADGLPAGGVTLIVEKA